MANEYDGSIKLAATFDTTYIKKSADEIRKEMDKAFDNTSAMKVTKEVENLRQSIRSVSKEYDVAKKRAEELENTVKETPAYDKLWESLTELKTKLVDARAELKRLQESGQDYGKTYYEALANVKITEEQILATEQKMTEMRNKGTAFIYGSDTKEYADTIKQMDDAANKMRILKERTNEQAVANLKSSNGWKAMGIALGTVGKDISNLLNKLKNLTKQLLKAASNTIVNGFKKLGSAIAGLGNHANSSEFNFKKLFRTLLKYGIGVRSFYVLYNKVRSAVVDGLQEMAKASGELSPLSIALNEFSTSLQYLKNSIATAFAPIATTVLPILTNFMDWLAEAIQKIGAFISALKGLSTYTKAVRTQYKSKEQQKAEKADIKSQNKANKAKYKEDLKAEKEAYKKDVASQKAAKKERDKEIREIEKANKSISKNNTTTNRNTKAKNKNTKALKANNAEIKKQKDTLAGFDDLDVLGREEEDENVLDDVAEAANSLPQSLQNVPQALDQPIQDFKSALEELPEVVQDVEDSFKEASIPDWIQDLADKIKGFIDAGDWFGLGSFLGEKFNGLLQVVDDWINNVLRPKGVEWAHNIAELLNGLVASIDWKLLGKTLADGFNAVFDILNTFLTTFDFLKFGQGLGTAIKSWFDNIEWDLVGQTFANKWNALIHTIQGIVTTPGIWTSIGSGIGEMLRNVFQTLDIDGLATTFIAIFNGIFEMLKAFLDENPFEGFAEKIYKALNRLIHEINWKEAGETLGRFVMELLNVFWEVAENTDWRGLGEGIGHFLEGVPWGEVLTKVFEIIWNVLSGLIAGLFSTDGGKVFLAVVAGIEALKIAFALGANILLPAIEKILIEKLATLLVTNGIGSIFTAAASAVASAFTAILGYITTMGAAVVTGISTLLTTITTVIKTALTFLFSPQGLVIAAIAAAITLLVVLIYENWDAICDFFTKAGEWLVDLFNQLPVFIEEVLKAVGNIFIAWINIQITAFEIFANAIIAVVNTIISGINLLLGPLSAVTEPLLGLSVKLPTIPQVKIPRVPYLAQGAVIPPNKQFLAMLGDQKSGTNIEAPLDTIVEAFREVVGNMNVQNTGYSEMTLDGQVFARLATPYIISELNRKGYDVTVLEG